MREKEKREKRRGGSEEEREMTVIALTGFCMCATELNDSKLLKGDDQRKVLFVRPCQNKNVFPSTAHVLFLGISDALISDQAVFLEYKPG